MNVEKRLKLWQQAGLISEDQSEKILRYEEERPSANWVIYGLSGLGIFVVLTGVISLIAANWYELSSYMKLALYFVTFLGLATAAYWRENTAGVVRESLICALGLYTLAGIGLISQIYHLQGDSYQAIFFWLAIILPLALSSKSRMLNNIWFLAFTVATFLWVVDSNLIFSSKGPELDRLYIAISLPYLFLALGYGLATVISENFCSAARFWSYVVLLIPFAVAGNIAWISNMSHFFKEPIGNLPFIPWFAVALAMLCAYLRKIQPGHFRSHAILFTLSASALLFLLPITINVGEHKVIGCALFIAVWSGAATIAAAIEKKRLFDLAALIIGIRFIFVYFEVFGSLAATGIGLIISGAVILGTAYAWHSYRGQIARSIREAA